jgi:LEA14-like dessication related protein
MCYDGWFLYGIRPFFFVVMLPLSMARERESPFVKKYKYLLLLLTFIALAGCSSFVKEPVVTVKDLKVVSLDAAGAGMELSLAVKNPNPYDIKLLGFSYDLKVMSLPLTKGGAREEIKFPSHEETEVKIPIRIPYGDLLEILKRMPNPDAVPYQLAAGLDLDSPLGQLSVPVSRSGTYMIPKRYRPSAILGKFADFFK